MGTGEKAGRDRQLGHINLKQRRERRKHKSGNVKDTLKFRFLSGCACETCYLSFHVQILVFHKI